MKRLIILLCVFAITSCNIKNKFLNSGEHPLGVPRAPELIATFEDNTTVGITQSEITEVETTELKKPTSVLKESPSTFNWYYLILIGGLGIIACLVYRLKKQNMVKVD